MGNRAFNQRNNPGSHKPGSAPAENKQQGSSVRAMLSSLDSIDEQQWKRLLSQRAVLTSLSSDRALFDQIRTTIESDCSANTLVKIWYLLEALSETPIRSNERRTISTERCVIVLQRKDPIAAAKVARLALDAGLPLEQLTILATASKAVAVASTYEDLEAVVSLWESALREKKMDLRDYRVVGQCDAFLGGLCEPELSKGRLSRHYTTEQSLVDVSKRMTLGARLALAATDGGVCFNDASNQERISLTIRALSSVGCLTNLLGRYHQGEASSGNLLTARQEMKINIPIPEAGKSDLNGAQQIQVGRELLTAALTLAQRCYITESSEDGAILIQQPYILRGSTISTLLKDLERSKLALGDAERESVAVITFSALELENLSTGDKLLPSTVNAALGLVVRKNPTAPGAQKPATGITAVRQADSVMTILYRGLGKITERSFLTAAIDTLAEACDANQDDEKRYVAQYTAIEDRLGELPPVPDPSGASIKKANDKSPSAKPQTGWFSKLLDGPESVRDRRQA
jgi:hypothetical protein